LLAPLTPCAGSRTPLGGTKHLSADAARRPDAVGFARGWDRETLNCALSLFATEFAEHEIPKSKSSDRLDRRAREERSHDCANRAQRPENARETSRATERRPNPDRPL